MQNLYEFTARDNDRLTDAELYSKLSHTDKSRRPIFDRVDSSTIQQQKTEHIANSTCKKDESVIEKKHARLNTKGKIILGVYLAVIVLVAVLIIVNANKINKGIATTPSSKIYDNSRVVSVESESVNISESMQIDSKYEVRI